jgi:F0F1-type ATP synthase membrane subunit c/vacuolar-type H+-ATPase subunit K
MKLFLRTVVFTILIFFCLLKSVSPVHAALASFTFNNFTLGGAKIAGLPFQVTITARDEFGLVVTTFNSVINITDGTGTIYPTQTSDFVNGVWTGYVYITQATTSTYINASYSGKTGNSDNFSVLADSRIKYLTVFAGNNQTGTVNTLLTNGLVAKVVDPYNNPVTGASVNFLITSYPTGATGQTLSTYSGVSNASGNVATTMTLGRKAGTYVVTASMASGISNTTSFYETAVPDVLTSLNLSPSVGVIPIGGYMAFTAKGYDQFLNEKTLSSVTWSVINGGGTIDNTGIFYGGDIAGTYLNTVRASSSGVGALASVTLLGSGSGSGSGSGGVGSSESATPAPTPTPSPTAVPATATPTASSSAQPSGSGGEGGAGVLNSISITPDVITALKNARIPVVAEGVDIYGNTVSNVNFSFSVTGNLGTLTQTSANTVLLTASESGIGTVTVVATQGNVTKIAKIVGSVGTGLNRRLVIEAVSSPQAVGEPFTISIAAKDSLNNFLTDYKGPIVLADTTGSIDPTVVQPNDSGIWYVQAIINLSNPEVSITAAGDGMIGVSNIFEVTGNPKQSDVGYGAGGGGAAGGGGGGGLGDVMGASISGKIKELLQDKSLNKFTVARFIGAGLAAGIGILGASIGGSIMASRGLEALGRNPFAKTKLKLNLYLSIIAFLLTAGLAVLASFLIVR